jgi:hypothetical protein
LQVIIGHVLLKPLLNLLHDLPSRNLELWWIRIRFRIHVGAVGGSGYEDGRGLITEKKMFNAGKNSLTG